MVEIESCQYRAVGTWLAAVSGVNLEKAQVLPTRFVLTEKPKAESRSQKSRAMIDRRHFRSSAFLVALLAVGILINRASAKAIPDSNEGDESGNWAAGYQQGLGDSNAPVGHFAQGKRASSLHELDKWAVLHDVMEAGRRRRR